MYLIVNGEGWLSALQKSNIPYLILLKLLENVRFFRLRMRLKFEIFNYGMDYRSGDSMAEILGCGKHSVVIAGTSCNVTADMTQNCSQSDRCAYFQLLQPIILQL